jgi:hypothetical protein
MTIDPATCRTEYVYFVMYYDDVESAHRTRESAEAERNRLRAEYGRAYSAFDVLLKD